MFIIYSMSQCITFFENLLPLQSPLCKIVLSLALDTQKKVAFNGAITSPTSEFPHEPPLVTLQLYVKSHCKIDKRASEL